MILWLGLGLCFILFIFFCVLSAIHSSGKEVSTQKPPFSYPSPESGRAEQKVVNISEPVLSFVDTVRKQPQRFLASKHPKFLTQHRPYELKDFYYGLWDTKTGEWWHTDAYNRVHICSKLNMSELDTKRNSSYSDHSWLTGDEMTYLIKEVTVIYEARKDRVEKLKTLRKQRRDKQERSRLMKIYAGDL